MEKKLHVSTASQGDPPIQEQFCLMPVSAHGYRAGLSCQPAKVYCVLLSWLRCMEFRTKLTFSRLELRHIAVCSFSQASAGIVFIPVLILHVNK